MVRKWLSEFQVSYPVSKCLKEEEGVSFCVFLKSKETFLRGLPPVAHWLELLHILSLNSDRQGKGKPVKSHALKQWIGPDFPEANGYCRNKESG